ncbi:hypothetical protein SO694_00246013 [Aureococcus anophagefferens]|uniref:Uncharacterized protein n=1 Tax=Aureococcus anophagefferens TaxID=44056 RepID=A0ABR1FRL6_AURAN
MGHFRSLGLRSKSNGGAAWSPNTVDAYVLKRLHEAVERGAEPAVAAARDAFRVAGNRWRAAPGFTSDNVSDFLLAPAADPAVNADRLEYAMVFAEEQRAHRRVVREVLSLAEEAFARRDAKEARRCLLVLQYLNAFYFEWCESHCDEPLVFKFRNVTVIKGFTEKMKKELLGLEMSQLRPSETSYAWHHVSHGKDMLIALAPLALEKALALEMDSAWRGARPHHLCREEMRAVLFAAYGEYTEKPRGEDRPEWRASSFEARLKELIKEDSTALVRAAAEHPMPELAVKPTAAPRAAEKSAYEQKRDARIARNAEFLQSLGLGNGSGMRKPAKKRRKGKASTPSTPSRASTRPATAANSAESTAKKAAKADRAAANAVVDDAKFAKGVADWRLQEPLQIRAGPEGYIDAYLAQCHDVFASATTEECEANLRDYCVERGLDFSVANAPGSDLVGKFKALVDAIDDFPNLKRGYELVLKNEACRDLLGNLAGRAGAICVRRAMTRWGKRKAPPRKREVHGCSKEPKWTAAHVIHECFDDRFPELAACFKKSRYASSERHTYYLGRRQFANAADADAAVGLLRTLFGKLDAACEGENQLELEACREAFAPVLAEWTARAPRKREAPPAAAASKKKAKAPDAAAVSDIAERIGGYLPPFSRGPFPRGVLEAVAGRVLDVSVGGAVKPSTKPSTKEPKWTAAHVIHDHFDDRFPELAARYRPDDSRNYYLGRRQFANAADADAAVGLLRTLFGKLDAACEGGDALKLEACREAFAPCSRNGRHARAGAHVRAAGARAGARRRLRRVASARRSRGALPPHGYPPYGYPPYGNYPPYPCPYGHLPWGPTLPLEVPSGSRQRGSGVDGGARAKLFAGRPAAPAADVPDDSQFDVTQRIIAETGGKVYRVEAADGGDLGAAGDASASSETSQTLSRRTRTGSHSATRKTPFALADNAKAARKREAGAPAPAARSPSAAAASADSAAATPAAVTPAPARMFVVSLPPRRRMSWPAPLIAPASI